MVENLRKQIEVLEADITGLEEKIRTKKAEKATVAAQVQAQIFLERIFAPYMEGLCDTWGLSPEEGLKALIKENISLDMIAANNQDELKEFLSQPEVRVITAMVRPLREVPDKGIKDRMTALLEVMEKIRPELANVIITTQGGQKWFLDSLTGLRDILFGVPPKLSHVTA